MGKSPLDSLKPHPAADLFPMMSEEEMSGLVESMRQHGYDTTKPVIVMGHQIIDGRNRYKAAGIAGVKAATQSYNPRRDGDPFDFVVRTNLHRRHLTTSQRAMVAERLATLRRGGDHQSPKMGIGLPEAAKQLGVGRGTVEQARTVRREAPDLAEKVERGEMTVGKAAAEVKARKSPKKKKPPERPGASVVPARVRKAVELMESMTKHERAAYFAYIDSWRREHGE